MTAVPLAIPLAWSSLRLILLQSVKAQPQNGSDCLPQRRSLR
jgi:hypothetical protein